MQGEGNNWERELEYYRRECNDLGARLLRLQEEQSHAHREARRSRTVVKLLRETYRLADFASTTRDVGGAMLELVVDNTMCDRAALLREEMPESGQFVMFHAIGLPDSALATVVEVPQPPAFLFTSSLVRSRSAEKIVAALGVPNILWAYDKGSRHALVIGNHSETNVSRAFEMGDQELIESALSIYLDVLYRKHAEAQLRQAKQAAEQVRDSRLAFVAELANRLRIPIDSLIELCGRRPVWTAPDCDIETSRSVSDEVMRLALQAQSLLDDASRGDTEPPLPVLEPEWTMVDDIVQSALRTAYAASIVANVEIECRMPSRRVAILVDREGIGGVVRRLVAAAVKATPAGGTVRVSASRFSDGGLGIFFGSRGAGSLAVAHPAPEKSLDGASWSDGESLEFARRTVEAHGGTLTIESSTFVGTNVRLMLPHRVTRDAEISMIGDDEA